MIYVKILGSILASAFVVHDDSLWDKCMKILEWMWGMYGLVVVLNEK